MVTAVIFVKALKSLYNGTIIVVRNNIAYPFPITYYLPNTLHTIPHPLSLYHISSANKKPLTTSTYHLKYTKNTHHDPYLTELNFLSLSVCVIAAHITQNNIIFSERHPVLVLKNARQFLTKHQQKFFLPVVQENICQFFSNKNPISRVARRG